jgi:uncharacterized protein (TIGR03437 family)
MERGIMTRLNESSCRFFNCGAPGPTPTVRARSAMTGGTQVILNGTCLAYGSPMKHAFWWLTLFVGAVNAIAGGSFPLGTDFARQIAPSTLTGVVYYHATAVDGTGAIYVAGQGVTARLPATTVLASNPGILVNFAMKLSLAGEIVYLVTLDLYSSALAVDSSGSLYLAGGNQVVKLNSAGTELAYTASLGDGFKVSGLDGLAVDSTGHAYVTGSTASANLATTPGAFQTSPPNASSNSFVIKLNLTGTAFEYATYLSGGDDYTEGIAVDSTGAVFIRGIVIEQSPNFPITPGAYQATGTGPYLVRLAPDGSHLIYGTLLGVWNDDAVAVAADPAGNAVVVHRYAYDSSNRVNLMRFNAAGELTWQSQALPVEVNGSGLVVDTAGTAYLSGFAASAAYPTKSNLTECGSVILSAFDSTGNLLQSTYVGVADSSIVDESRGTALALGPNGNIYVATPAALASLSSNSPPQLAPLGCVGNAATLGAEPFVAPGEIVSLFGEGLGPQQGVQPDMTLQKSFPTTLAGVQVTFDGIPAPLLYVQGTQINAIAPSGLTAGQSTNLCVVYNGVPANCLKRPVQATAPGVFTVDGTYAAAMNQDGTINSAANPAKYGCLVSVFVNGLGSLTPSAPDGAIIEAPLPTLVEPVSLIAEVQEPFSSIPDLIPLTIQYAGPAPGQVAGVSQVNFVATFPAKLTVSAGASDNGRESNLFNVYTASNPNGSKCP